MNMVISSIVVPRGNLANPEVLKGFYAQAKGGDELTLRILNKEVSIINGEIHQYTVAYYRHVGVVSGRKKGEGNSEVSGKEK